MRLTTSARFSKRAWCCRVISRSGWAVMIAFHSSGNALVSSSVPAASPSARSAMSFLCLDVS
jgi:hypothetical protein